MAPATTQAPPRPGTSGLAVADDGQGGSSSATAEVLTRVAVAVNSTLELPQVLGRLVEVVVETIPARATVFTLEGDQLIPQTAAGQRTSDELFRTFRSMAPIRLQGARASQYAAREPVVIADARDSELVPADWAEVFDVRTAVLAPLFAADEPCGLLTLDWQEQHAVADAELSLIRMIAEYAGLAIRNARLYETEALHARRLECLYQLSTAYSEGAHAGRLVRQLNALLADEGVEVTGMSFRNRRITRHLGTERPTKAERALWRDNADVVALPDGGTAVPMRLGRRCVGSLRLAASDLRAEHRAFVEALAAGVAEVANRAALRADVERAAHERAVASERERLQADLHDTAGQTFAAIGLISNREAARHVDADTVDRFVRLASLAEKGRSELDQAIQALAFAPAGRRRLVASLRAFCRSVQDDSGMRVEFNVDGPLRRLPNRVEYALYRVGAEALMNSWRHARASYTRVQLTRADHDLTLEVVDDGVGLEARHQGSVHTGIDSMRRTAAEVGARLRVRSRRPRGAMVQMRIPLSGNGRPA